MIRVIITDNGKARKVCFYAPFGGAWECWRDYTTEETPEQCEQFARNSYGDKITDIMHINA